MKLQWQFVLGAGLSSRLIAWYGQGYGGWSHVDLILPDGSCLGARSDRVGGVPPGVQIRPPAYETWVYRTVIELTCTGEQAGLAIDFAMSQLGCQYDTADILGFILGRQMHNQGQWVCSALQLPVAQAAKLVPPLHVTPQQCPPNMLFSILNAVGGRVIEEHKA